MISPMFLLVCLLNHDIGKFFITSSFSGNHLGLAIRSTVQVKSLELLPIQEIALKPLYKEYGSFLNGVVQGSMLL